jgi:serine protease
VAFKADARPVLERPLAVRQQAADVASAASARAAWLQARAGVALVAGRVISPRLQVLQAQGLTSEELAARLRAHPDVAYAVVDRRRRATVLPDDPLYTRGPSTGIGPDSGQWYLRPPTAAVASSINAEQAWDIATGSANVVVAVLDSGVLGNHPDLIGRVLPGYDFIHVADVANDGDGRDSNATDPGDWVTTAENNDRRGTFYQCGASSSSWHGTLVSGIIGAVANNGQGMAGAAYGVRILPVRVLGKCGGYDSDIVAGMYWAAGIDQPGLDGSSTPARILNMSLGGAGACEAPYLEAVQAITARGGIVVAAAGNSTGHDVGSPANCAGVVAVAGLRHAGSKVGFSDLGSRITISAPGGNCINIGEGEPCLYPILSTTNSGTRGPLSTGWIYSDAFSPTVGTSFAAPLVAATVALMVSARPQATVDQLLTALRVSARPFPTTGGDNGVGGEPVLTCRPPDGTDQLQCYCTTALCGAGMTDARAALLALTAFGSREEAAGRLMNFGETNFPQFFPERAATQRSGPFLFRHYPSKGVYLGVVVEAGQGYVLDGVYVLGGPFGDQPLYMGQVSQFIGAATASMLPALAPLRATARR